MRPTHSRAILPDPPEQLKAHSRRLAGRLREAIRAEGPMPFSRYMERALYEPGLGYYSAGLHKFGPAGDFVTAPELGSVFARCLARSVAAIGATLGRFEVLEIGAGTGRLAADLLTALAPECPPARYRILERSADLRAVQRQRLADLDLPGGVSVEWLDEPPGKPWQGVLIANEVIDALAVERFELDGGDILQLCVEIDGEGFAWRPGRAPEPLRARLAELLEGLHPAWPPGYRSEICLALPAWLAAVTGTLEAGVALVADYGLPRRAYYHPERRDGTLVCHYRHRAHADPFRWPGLQDISAWVDFTALAEAARASALEVAAYTTQAQFLLGSGLPQILEDLDTLPDRERLALADEVRELTLPGAMGERFQVMALARDCSAPLPAFTAGDLLGSL